MQRKRDKLTIHSIHHFLHYWLVSSLAITDNGNTGNQNDFNRTRGQGGFDYLHFQ